MKKDEAKKCVQSSKSVCDLEVVAENKRKRKIVNANNYKRKKVSQTNSYNVCLLNDTTDDPLPLIEMISTDPVELENTTDLLNLMGN